jgi:anti-sigma B factor antagonist
VSDERLLQLSAASAAPGERVVRIAGELDMAGMVDARSLLTTTIVSGDTRSIVIDLAGLRFIDASGARVLAAARRLAAASGVRYEISGACGHVDTVLRVLGLIELADPPLILTEAPAVPPRG